MDTTGSSNNGSRRYTSSAVHPKFRDKCKRQVELSSHSSRRMDGSGIPRSPIFPLQPIVDTQFKSTKSK
ncbi:hypothetical protein AAC387_Pa06g1669 [Persea americana]